MIGVRPFFEIVAQHGPNDFQVRAESRLSPQMRRGNGKTSSRPNESHEWRCIETGSQTSFSP